jgi:hypothetical protein
MNLETKEVALVKQKANKTIREVEDIKITSSKGLIEGQELLSKITNTQKTLKSVKEGMTRPIMEGLKKIRELFSPIEDNLDIANKSLKVKILDYNEKVKKEEAQKTEQITEKLKSGELTFEKASQKIEKVSQKVEAVPIRKIREVKIINEEKVPKKYWEINMVLLRKDSLSGIDVPGTKVVEREIIVSK